MADWAGIRAAIAAIAAGTAGIAEGTSTELQGISDLPAVKVTHVENAVQTDRGAGYRMREVTIKGKLLVGRSGDAGDAISSVETYAEALTDSFEQGVLLGYPGTVQDSWLESWQTGPQEFAREEWVGAELTWKVMARENLTRSA